MSTRKVRTRKDAGHADGSGAGPMGELIPEVLNRLWAGDQFRVTADGDILLVWPPTGQTLVVPAAVLDELERRRLIHHPEDGGRTPLTYRGTQILGDWYARRFPGRRAAVNRYGERLVIKRVTGRA